MQLHFFIRFSLPPPPFLQTLAPLSEDFWRHLCYSDILMICFSCILWRNLKLKVGHFLSNVHRRPCNWIYQFVIHHFSIHSPFYPQHDHFSILQTLLYAGTYFRCLRHIFSNFKLLKSQAITFGTMTLEISSYV